MALKHPGKRRPCFVCGSSRKGEPRNSTNRAICRNCLPDWTRARAARTHLSVYLGAELKAALVKHADAAGMNVPDFTKEILRGAFGLK